MSKGKFTIVEELEELAARASQFSSQKVAEVAKTAAAALREIAAIKADKPTPVSVSIPTSGWGSDSNANYPNYYDITAGGVTAKDRADVVISPESVGAASACGMCPTTETLEGKIRIRAVSVPSGSIAAQYWAGKGA